MSDQKNRKKRLLKKRHETRPRANKNIMYVPPILKIKNGQKLDNNIRLQINGKNSGNIKVYKKKSKKLTLLFLIPIPLSIILSVLTF